MQTDSNANIHHILARAFSGALERSAPDKGEFERRLTDRLAAAEATADDRVLYANTVGMAWLTIGGVAAVAMLALGAIGSLAGGREGRRVGVAIAAAVAMFCAAGSFYGAWRWHYALRARRLERLGKTDTAAYRRNMERSLPRDSSLIGQALVGIVTAALALTAW